MNPASESGNKDREQAKWTQVEITFWWATRITRTTFLESCFWATRLGLHLRLAQLLKTWSRPRRSFSSLSQMWESLYGLRLDNNTVTKSKRNPSSFRSEIPVEEWEPDACATKCSMLECSTRFSEPGPWYCVGMRHHCRSCGRVVCDACSQGRVIFHSPTSTKLRPARVCDACWHTEYFISNCTGRQNPDWEGLHHSQSPTPKTADPVLPVYVRPDQCTHYVLESTISTSETRTTTRSTSTEPWKRTRSGCSDGIEEDEDLLSCKDTPETNPHLVHDHSPNYRATKNLDIPYSRNRSRVGGVRLPSRQDAECYYEGLCTYEPVALKILLEEQARALAEAAAGSGPC